MTSCLGEINAHLVFLKDASNINSLSEKRRRHSIWSATISQDVVRYHYIRYYELGEFFAIYKNCPVRSFDTAPWALKKKRMPGQVVAKTGGGGGKWWKRKNTLRTRLKRCRNNMPVEEMKDVDMFFFEVRVPLQAFPACCGFPPWTLVDSPALASHCFKELAMYVNLSGNHPLRIWNVKLKTNI